MGETQSHRADRTGSCSTILYDATQAKHARMAIDISTGIDLICIRVKVDIPYCIRVGTLFTGFPRTLGFRAL